MGIYDYDSQADEGLNFRKGDIMYILSTEGEYWWFAQSLVTGKEGYIPSNSVAESLDAEE